MTVAVVLAHAGDPSNPSGGTNRVTAFAEGLAEAGHDVTLVVPEPAGGLPERLSAVALEPVAVGTEGVRSQPTRALRIARRARRLAADRGATLQFEHSTLGGVGSLLGSSGFVLDMHDLAFPSPLYAERPLGSALQRVVRWVEGRGVRDAGAILVVSEPMRDLVAGEWGVDPATVEVIPNGYFPGVLRGVETDEPGGTRVAFLGTLHPKLDVGAIVETARLPAVDETVVVGEGARLSDLRAASRRLEAGRLRVPGQLPDAEAFGLLKGADVAINPQRPSRLQRASSPVKLYYYAALGVPMVVSAGPAVADELGREGAARVVSPDESFPDAVASLLDADTGRERMADRAREVAGRFTWDDRTDRLVEFYRERVDPDAGWT